MIKCKLKKTLIPLLEMINERTEVAMPQQIPADTKVATGIVWRQVIKKERMNKILTFKNGGILSVLHTLRQLCNPYFWMNSEVKKITKLFCSSVGSE